MLVARQIKVVAGSTVQLYKTEAAPSVPTNDTVHRTTVWLPAPNGPTDRVDAHGKNASSCKASSNNAGAAVLCSSKRRNKAVVTALGVLERQG